MAAAGRTYMCFVIFACVTPYLVHCLYEDQVGSFDWRQSFLGKVKFAFFDASTHSSKKLFVATEANVLAALNSRTGNILWRHVLEEREGKIDSLLHHGSILVSVSGSGKFLRSWDISTGSLLWEAYSRNSFQMGADQPEIFRGWNGITAVIAEKDGGADLVMSLANSTVRAHSIEDGSEVWTQQASVDQGILYHSLQYFSGFLYIIGIREEANQLVIRKLNAKNGKLVNEQIIPAQWISEKSASCVFVMGKNMACVETFSNSIQIISLTDGSFHKGVSLSSLGVDETLLRTPELQTLGSTTNSWDKRSEFLLKMSPKHQIILNLAEDLSVNVIKEYTSTALLISSVLANRAFVVSLADTEETLHLGCFDLDSRKELKDLAQIVKLPKHQGKPEKASMYMFTKKDSEIGYRVFLTTTDHSASLIQLPGRIAWTREEALASITAVDIIELPFSPSQANFETLQEEFGGQPDDDILSMFIRRIRAQAKQFQVLVNQFQAFVNAQQEHGLFAESTSSEEEQLTRDQFNLRKLILIVTESGKLFGLDSSSGGIVWKNFLPDLAPYSNNGRLYHLLYAQRTVAHFPLTAQNVLLGQSRSTDGTLIHIFDPITGKSIGTSDVGGTLLPYKVLQAMILPHIDSKHTRLLVLLDDKLASHVFPSTSEALEIIAKKANSIFFFLAEKEHTSLKGYVLQSSSKRDTLTAMEVWNVNMPSGHQATTIATKSPFEPVHSQGKVLGDRRVLYKYLNPNLIAVGTESHGDKPSISILLIDAVTGMIISHNRHKNAKGPLHLVHSENWVVYTLYNTKSRRYEISVLEVYEGYNRRNSTAFSSLDPPPHPMVLQQAYIFTTTVRTLSVTTTELGITHKNLLLGLQNGYIYSLPKNYLDPRRTFTPTPQDREEGLVEYMPEIYTNPIAFINYNQTVANMHGIFTAGSGLESTCLVFAYGLDLYWTRVTPSRMFDVLKEDFDYWFIVGTLAVLVLVTFVSQRLAAIKMLRQAWL